MIHLFVKQQVVRHVLPKDELAWPFFKDISGV